MSPVNLLHASAYSEYNERFILILKPLLIFTALSLENEIVRVIPLKEVSCKFYE